jgi:hypothetical protein
VLAVLSLFCSGTARAEGANPALAEELFRQGQALMQQKAYAEACPKFAESQRLDPGTGTLLNLAVCHERQGKLASAWAEFSEVEVVANRDGRKDRVAFAHEHLTAIEPRLSRLRIQLVAGAAVPDLEIRLDGAIVGAPALGVSVPIDAGTHQVTASAPGRVPWELTLEVPMGPHENTLNIPALAAVPQKTASTVATTSSLPALPAQRDHRIFTQRNVALGVGALGLVGFGVGSYFGLRAIAKNDDSNRQGCIGNDCDPAAAQTRRDARTAGNWSTVAFVAGGAALSAAAVLYLTAPSKSASTSMAVNRPRALVSLSNQGGSLELRTVW